jgi:hypothetical protein
MALGRWKGSTCAASGVFEMHDLQIAYVTWRADLQGRAMLETTIEEIDGMRVCHDRFFNVYDPTDDQSLEFI